MPHGKQADHHPQHAEVILTPFGPNRPRIPFEPRAFKVMAIFIGISAGAAAPDDVRDAGTQAWIPLPDSTITTGIAADKIVVDGWLINNGNDCVWAIDEKTGVLRDDIRRTEQASFDRVGTLDQVWVDPIGLRLRTVYIGCMRWFGGDIYDLGHVEVMVPML